MHCKLNIPKATEDIKYTHPLKPFAVQMLVMVFKVMLRTHRGLVGKARTIL